jgi:hypothetical protein
MKKFDEIRRRRFKEVIQFVGKSSILANWVQLNGQNLKNHKNSFKNKINHKTFPFLNLGLKHVQNISLDFKFLCYSKI